MTTPAPATVCKEGTEKEWKHLHQQQWAKKELEKKANTCTNNSASRIGGHRGYQCAGKRN
jgi:hypothetical protein